MKRALSRRTIALIIVATMTLGGYIGTYFATTEIFNGQIENDIMDLRLFESPNHMAVFRPLISLEEYLRSASEIEFYGHIKNGASLPPSRLATELTQMEQPPQPTSELRMALVRGGLAKRGNPVALRR